MDNVSNAETTGMDEAARDTDQLCGLADEESAYSQQWPLHFSYEQHAYSPSRPDGSEYEAGCWGVPLYAPVPVSFYSTYPDVTTCAVSLDVAEQHPASHIDVARPEGMEHQAASHIDDTCPQGGQQQPPSRSDFTPSQECRLPTWGGYGRFHDAGLADLPRVPPVESATDELGPAEGGTSEGDHSTILHSLPAEAVRLEQSDDECKAHRLLRRKTYFRDVADHVGFAVTDPDTIASHDKKRLYLRCLEQYVEWLHEQIRLAGQEPVPMERIPTYRGLKSRSLRTILVHKQQTVYNLNLQKTEAEEKFMELQNAIVMMQFAPDPSVSQDRASVSGAASEYDVSPFTYET